jgi:DNA-binding XRE family transcriptional regulator
MRYIADKEVVMAVTKAERAKQKKIANDWIQFRGKHLFSQVRLAEALGISRRAVQYTESGRSHNPNWGCIPTDETQAKFRALQAKFEKEAA